MPPSTPRLPVSGPDSGPEPPFPIRLSGPVIKGFGRGSKELGIPTANIPVDGLEEVLPEELGVGVYFGVVALDPETAPGAGSEAGGVDGHGKETGSARILPAVLSIGYNPFYKNKTRSIEIHILPSLTSPSPTATASQQQETKVKFHKLPDFYGTKLNLLMLGYIRPEYDYVSVEALVEDIRVDCEVARRSLLREAYRVYLDDDTGSQGEVDEKVRGERGWLSSTQSHRPKPSSPRHLYVTSDALTFDKASLSRFEAEGFTVEYLPFPTRSDDIERERKDLEKTIHTREDDLEPGERYGIVAYGRPAYLLLLSHHQQTSTNPFPCLCAFVAFYPEPPHAESLASPSPPPLPPSTTAASTSTSSAYETVPTLPIQIHLAGSQNQSVALWDDSNKRHRCHLLFYPESEPGFADFSTAPTHDRISSRLAWGRALECLKRGFGWPGSAGNWGAPEPEMVWEAYWRNIYDAATRQSSRSTSSSDILGLMVGGGTDDHDFDDKTCVHCVPSAVGGSSPSEIANFYSSQFIPSGPPSQHMRLLSRTASTNRVIDELLLTFEHTEEIPWLLPGVPPTGHSVRITLVMTASFCAGKIGRHTIYWDQASVLVQIGLLDLALIPPGFRATGPNREGKDVVERIPVVGEEAVDSVLD
ncbi:riboflavin kinase-domain-containing protein [Aspergillus cavernicola]|uniref:riboflavin kinase n=1 Tax=Aspergillus cavernicola TaxID=176166 RepID=A0ABR4HX03_9EURO